jgi:hypothetical protein
MRFVVTPEAIAEVVLQIDLQRPGVVLPAILCDVITPSTTHRASNAPFQAVLAPAELSIREFSLDEAHAGIFHPFASAKSLMISCI